LQGLHSRGVENNLVKKETTMRDLTTEELKQVSGGVTFNPPGQPSFTLSGPDIAVTFTVEAGQFTFKPLAGITATHS
jgi:bacteriocin-like protein